MRGKRNWTDSGVASRGAPAFRLQPLLTLGPEVGTEVICPIFLSSSGAHKSAVRPVHAPGFLWPRLPVPGPPAGSEPLAARPDGSVRLQLLVV